VQDQGIGIQLKNATIFEPFYRASNVTNGNCWHRIGLASVSQINRAARGTSPLESKEGVEQPSLSIYR